MNYYIRCEIFFNYVENFEIILNQFFWRYKMKRKNITWIFLFFYISIFLLLTLFSCSNNPGSTTIDQKNIVILSLNLHTYQETNQDAKFNIIVDAIFDLSIDLVCFQECGQNKNQIYLTGSSTIRIDNMAYIITQKLKSRHGVDYYYAWDWAHIGFDYYEEGMAVVSKYPITDSGSTWISTNTSSSNITSRKAVYGKTEIPGVGIVNLFSVHTHWMLSSTDTEHELQVSRIKNFVYSKEIPHSTIKRII